MGAELVRLEYGSDTPWIAVAAYAIASGTSIMRVWNEKHWFTDVLAGAGMGMLSARIGWWLLPSVNRVTNSVLGLDATHGQWLAVSPVANNGHLGLVMCLSF
jgi:membrane-associated phospholipid phosphatase